MFSPRFKNRVVSLLLLLVFPLFFSACFFEDEPPVEQSIFSPIPGPQGNGAGYGGGDGPLAYARKLLKLGLSQYRDNLDSQTFGDCTGCQNLNEPILCNLLIGLSPVQKDFLQTFMTNALDQMLALNRGATMTPFDFTVGQMELASGEETTRDLAAKTKLGPGGIILFNEDMVRAMSDWQRLQLLTHEFGHKVEDVDPNHHFIDDNSIIGPFSSGILFLDTLGAAMATYIASHIGKTAVTFPKSGAVCDFDSLNLTLLGAPYFFRPDEDSGTLNGDTDGLNGPGGQTAADMKSVIKAIDDNDGDFTITAWVRVFDDLADSDAEYPGQIIFSNMNYDTIAYQSGLELFRLSNGNFGAYAGTDRVIDSGIKVEPGGFHLVVLKRTGGTLQTFVDGIEGNSDSALFFYDWEARDIMGGIDESSGLALPTIGKAGCNPAYSDGSDYTRLDFWKGNVASVSLYDKAISNDEISSLFQCASSDLTVPTSNVIGPPYPQPVLQTDGTVHVTVIKNNILYLGGDFRHIGSKLRIGLAAIDITTGEVLDWNPVVNNEVFAIAVSDDGNTVYAGGNYFRAGGQDRRHLAAFDAATGEILPWDPSPDSHVTALAVSGNIVYVGGRFHDSLIGGQVRDYIAAIDATTGLATDWNPLVDDDVYTIVVKDDLVYIGGRFWEVNEQDRWSLAAIDAAGEVTSWDPSCESNNYDIYKMTLSDDGNTVYIGGNFSLVGGQTRNNIAAIDINTGLATDWDPNADYAVRSLTVSGTTIYAGGNMTNIGGQDRNHVAAIDATTGLATDWNPNADDIVYATAVVGSTIYVGGDFISIGGGENPYFSLIDQDGNAL